MLIKFFLKSVKINHNLAMVPKKKARRMIILENEGNCFWAWKSFLTSPTYPPPPVRNCVLYQLRPYMYTSCL